MRTALIFCLLALSTHAPAQPHWEVLPLLAPNIANGPLTFTAIVPDQVEVLFSKDRNTLFVETTISAGKRFYGTHTFFAGPAIPCWLPDRVQFLSQGEPGSWCTEIEVYYATGSIVIPGGQEYGPPP